MLVSGSASLAQVDLDRACYPDSAFRQQTVDLTQLSSIVQPEEANSGTAQGQSARKGAQSATVLARSVAVPVVLTGLAQIVPQRSAPYLKGVPAPQFLEAISS